MAIKLIKYHFIDKQLIQKSKIKKCVIKIQLSALQFK